MSDLPDSWREILSRVDENGLVGVEVGPGEMEYFSPEELIGIEDEEKENEAHAPVRVHVKPRRFFGL